MNTAPKQPRRRELSASPEELFERYQAGDWSALEPLYDLFEVPLYRFAVRLLGSREDGADALQEMWYRAYLHRLDWRAGSSVKSWLFGILRNLCFDLLRKRKHESLLEAHDEALDSSFPSASVLADWYSTWSHTAFDPSFRATVDAGLQHLAPIYRVLMLYAFDDWSYAEMAEKEGISESQVKGRLYRAREQLKQYLTRSGYEPERTSTDVPRKRVCHG